MDISPRTQAIMLLTVRFGKSNSLHDKPLSNKEWSHLAIWMKEHQLDPAGLLQGDVRKVLSGWTDPRVTLDRLQALLDRGTALGLALEKWRRAGLWMLTRSDPEYPHRLKRRLGGTAPAVLFGCGSKDLLNSNGVAVVGSRDAGEEDLQFSRKLGQRIAESGYSVVSGGARGIDESSMHGALEGEGTVVGVLSDSLIKSAASSRFRKGIMSQSLTLMSPFNPEARFSVGNAMGRNKYIYCLSDASVVITSAVNRGGTWSGAIENINAAWVPLWVKQSTDPNSGNSELVKRGAKWLPARLGDVADLGDVTALLDQRNDAFGQCEQFTQPAGGAEIQPDFTQPAGGAEIQPDSDGQADLSRHIPANENAIIKATKRFNSPVITETDFYSLFINRLENLTRSDAMNLEELESHFDIERSQLRAWLKRGSSEGKIKRLMRPLRFKATSTEGQKSFAFEEG